MARQWGTWLLLVAAVAAIVWLLAQRISCVPPVEEIPVHEYEELPPPEVGAQDWPWWRGPDVNGIAPAQAEQDVPVEFSPEHNVVWKTPVPGRGHASPTVVGDRILLATADEDEQIQSVLCYDRGTGERLWETPVHEGNFERRVHADNTQASSTIASDGTRAFALFLNDKKVWLTALDFDGNILWQTDVGPFASQWGFGTSPAIHQSLVLVAADHDRGGFLAAVHRETGEIIWRTKRPAATSFCSPRVVRVAGKDQLLVSGCKQLAAYDPATGDELWSVEGTAVLTIGTVAMHDDLAIASGGWRGSETLCVRPDASGEVVWRNDVNIYSTSILSHDGFLYAVTDQGELYCWEAETGQQQWREGLGGSFSASPMLAGGNVYLCREDGAVLVFKANPNQYEPVAQNRLGDEIFASPAICSNRIYLRVAHGQGDDRQEVLYSIGKSKDTGNAGDDGKPVVGIHGRRGADLDAFGLIQSE